MVFANSDITWPSIILPWLLAPFKDLKMGGVRTFQCVRRLKTGPPIKQCINWLGVVYLEQCNFEILAIYGINGGTLCMSSRTYAILTRAVKNRVFLSGFWGER
jgi:hypothetical protein